MIRTEEEYRAALDEITPLFDAVFGTPECTRLSELCNEIIAYEHEHYPIREPSLWGRVAYWLESRWGMTLPWRKSSDR